MKSLRNTSYLLGLLALIIATAAQAAPQNPKLVAGQATVSQTGNSTIISQTTQKAIINWQSFSSASNQSIIFNQPGASAITLNRVTGVTPSILNGIASLKEVIFAM